MWFVLQRGPNSEAIDTVELFKYTHSKSDDSFVNQAVYDAYVSLYSFNGTSST